MKNDIWSAKDVEVFNWDEVPVSPMSKDKPHALYRLNSQEALFKIVLGQELFAEKSSRFHHHSTREILLMHSGKEFFIESDKGRKMVVPGSTVYIPRNVIHRVLNSSPISSQCWILIEIGWKKEDVIYVEKREGKWVKVEA